MGEGGRKAHVTLFRTVCPACGRVGVANWAPGAFDVRCRGCGAGFDYRGHTYRPVTGNMTDEERRERRRAQNRACYRRHAEKSREAMLIGYYNHHEARKRAMREAYHANREERLAKQRAYYAAHRDELNAKKRARRRFEDVPDGRRRDGVGRLHEQ